MREKINLTLPADLIDKAKIQAEMDKMSSKLETLADKLEAVATADMPKDAVWQLKAVSPRLDEISSELISVAARAMFDLVAGFFLQAMFLNLGNMLPKKGGKP
jgi:hypothetical protein